MTLCALCQSDYATTTADGYPMCLECSCDYTTPTTED